jgi:(2R)-3-sulfolactate dehydrogenase (NADP+)
MTATAATPEGSRPARQLGTAVADLLISAGIPSAQARVSARAIVLADVWGIGSHGILRMPSYLRRIEAGGVNASAGLREVRRTGSVVAFDGQAGLGHWQVWRAVDVALGLAAGGGVAVVSIGNSSHCGALGVYATRIREGGAAGIVLSNGPAAMPAWGGTRPLLSTSPVAGTATADGRGPIVDLALSAVTRGQIARLARSGTALEPGLAFDGDGRPTTDPAEALAGMIAPIGGPKGFALAYLVEALTGGLVGPALSEDVVDPFDVDRAGLTQRVAHLVIVIRPEAVDIDGLAGERLRRLEAAAQGSGGRMPGADRRLALAGRVALEDGLRDELIGWARRLGARTAEDVLSPV